MLPTLFASYALPDGQDYPSFDVYSLRPPSARRPLVFVRRGASAAVWIVTSPLCIMAPPGASATSVAATDAFAAIQRVRVGVVRRGGG